MPRHDPIRTTREQRRFEYGPQAGRGYVQSVAGSTPGPPIGLVGDVDGTGASTINATVIGLQARPLSATAPLDQQVLAWNDLAGQWVPATPAGGTGGGTGDIDGVVAGTGLNGGGTFGTVTLNLATPVSIANGGTGVGSIGAAPWLPLTGGTLSGSLAVGGNVNPTLAIVPGPYTALYSPDGSGTAGGIMLGSVAGYPGNVYRNTSHLFQNRDASITYASFDGPSAQNRYKNTYHSFENQDGSVIFAELGQANGAFVYSALTVEHTQDQLDLWGGFALLYGTSGGGKIGCSGQAEASVGEVIEGNGRWGGYFEGRRKEPAFPGQTYGIEVDVGNWGPSVVVDPYNYALPAAAGYTIGILSASGCGLSPTSPASVGVWIGQNTQRWNKGLMFGNDGLVTSIGSGGNGVAIELARGQSVRWLNSGGTVDGEIWANASGVHIDWSGLVSAGLVISNGIGAGFQFEDRTTPSIDWLLYADGGRARVYLLGVGDKLSIDNAGSLYLNANTTPTLGLITNYAGLWAPDGSGLGAGIFLGNAANALHVYSNTTHQFKNRAGTTLFAQIDATGLGLTTPLGVASGGTGGATAGAALTNLGGQPLDATLTALAGLNTTAGLVEQTGTDVFTKRAMGVAAGTSVLTRADGDARYLTTSGISGMTAGQIPIAATATTITSSGNLSGAVTTSGSLATTLSNNAVATAHITNANVTYAKIQNVAANRLLGNSTGSAAAPAEIALPLAVALGGTNAITAAAALTSLGAAPLASPSFTGDVTVAGGVKVGGNANPSLGISSVNYTALWAPDGSAVSKGIFVGDVTSGANTYYRNAGHTFGDISGSTTFLTIVAGGTTIGTPTGGAKGVGTLNATGVYAAGTLLTSDARLKRDIAPLPDNCLQLVTAIAPKRFRFIPREDGPPGFWDRQRWGFLAQDVAAAMTAAGHQFDGVEADAEGNLSLDPSALLACLWRSVQQLAEAARHGA